MINAIDFVTLMAPNKDGNSFKLAVVEGISPNNSAIIHFDGEEEPSNKNYPYLASYQANVNDRILLIRIGGTYIIIGKIQYA